MPGRLVGCDTVDATWGGGGASKYKGRIKGWREWKGWKTEAG